jgi:REP element-mobilizing transposase RayT
MPSSYTCLHYHIVFSTRQRLPQIAPDIRDRLYPYLGGIIRNRGGALLRAGGVADHVHLSCSLSPGVRIADCVRDIKSNSSGWVHEALGLGAFAWQTGYAAFTVSHSGLGRLHRYIDGQEAHHRKRGFREELMDILQRHEVEFEERYLD